MIDQLPTPQFITIVLAVAGLLGWVVRMVVKHVLDSDSSSRLYIEELVKTNQANTENFVSTINHNQTKMNGAIDGLTKAIEKQTEFLEIRLSRKKKNRRS